MSKVFHWLLLLLATPATAAAEVGCILLFLGCLAVALLLWGYS
jgi:hypothetical protein